VPIRMIDDDGCRAGSTNRLAHQGHTSVPDKPLQARRRAVHGQEVFPNPGRCHRAWGDLENRR
jgi:hypothetical protein